MEEASAGVGMLGLQETAAQAFFDATPVAGTGTGTPVPEKEVDEAANPPHARADASPENVSQETPAARTKEGDRGEVSVTLGAAAKSALGGRTFTALTGPNIGSQSSGSHLHKEWDDTTSSTDSGETSEARVRNLTLADLNKQLATVRESLWNAGLQFVEAEKIVDVNLFLASDSFAGCSATPAR
jgi:hypothetical protein